MGPPDDWSSQTILAKNGGGWPAINEPRTGDVEAACSVQIGMAETRDNGYVNDKLLKRESVWQQNSGAVEEFIFRSIPQFIYKSKSERIIGIGPHLPKLSKKIKVAPFYGPRRMYANVNR